MTPPAVKILSSCCSHVVSLVCSSTLLFQRFVPTHRRNTSDYSSDSSSAGNSPETQPHVSSSSSWFFCRLLSAAAPGSILTHLLWFSLSRATEP